MTQWWKTPPSSWCSPTDHLVLVWSRGAEIPLDHLSPVSQCLYQCASPYGIHLHTDTKNREEKQTINWPWISSIYTVYWHLYSHTIKNQKLYHRFQCFVIFAPSKSIVCSHVTDSMPGGSSTNYTIILRYLPYSIKTKASAAVIWDNRNKIKFCWIY